MDASRPPDDPGDPTPDIHPDHAFQLIMLHASTRAAWEHWRKSGDTLPPERADELATQRAARLSPRKPAKKKSRE